MSRDVMEEIKKELNDNKIVIYMKGTKDAPRCGFSAAAVSVLNEYGVPFKDIDVLADPEKWTAIKQYSDWPTVPQIFIAGELVGGCDVVREMHEKGELRPIIQKAVEG